MIFFFLFYEGDHGDTYMNWIAEKKGLNNPDYHPQVYKTGVDIDFYP
jgi:hypothetical protein